MKPRQRVRSSRSIASTAASWTGLAGGRVRLRRRVPSIPRGAIRSGETGGAGRGDGPARAVHRFAGVPAYLREVAGGVVERLRGRPAHPRRPASSDSGLVRLTHHRYTVVGPRFDRFVCAGCPAELVYSVLTPHSLPDAESHSTRWHRATRLTTRILGSTTAIGRDAIYFDQEDLRRNTGVYSDLYEWSRATGRVTRLTSEARVLDPDLSPDGTTLVAVRNHRGQRDLVLLRHMPRDAGRAAARRRNTDGKSRRSFPNPTRNSTRRDGRPTAARLPSSVTGSARRPRSCSSTSRPKISPDRRRPMRAAARPLRPGGPMDAASWWRWRTKTKPSNLFEIEPRCRCLRTPADAPERWGNLARRVA